MSIKINPLPCPHCGNLPGSLLFDFDFMPKSYYTVCYLCKTLPKFYGYGITEEASIEDWNKRIKATKNI